MGWLRWHLWHRAIFHLAWLADHWSDHWSRCRCSVGWRGQRPETTALLWHIPERSKCAALFGHLFLVSRYICNRAQSLQSCKRRARVERHRRRRWRLIRGAYFTRHLRLNPSRYLLENRKRGWPKGVHWRTTKRRRSNTGELCYCWRNI